MNKKFMNALLFSAALLSSGVVVTSCKDYDDDINELRDMIGQNTSLSEALQNQLNTLETAAETAQTTAETARTEAQQAAKDAADAQDEAERAAALARSEAAAALAAANEAREEAINGVKTELNNYKEEVTKLLANKVDNTTFKNLQEEVASLGSEMENKLSELAGEIEGIQSGLADEITSALNLRISTNEGNIRNLQDALAVLTGGSTNLEVQKATLKKYAALLSETGLQQDITSIEGQISTINETITSIQGEITTLKGSVSTNTNDIADINSYITDTLTPKLTEVDNSIRDINSGLSQLHVLIAARLSSITFAPDYFVDGVEAIVFNSLEYGDMTDKDETWELVESVLPAKYSTAALATASYHFNPASFKLTNADYQYIDRQVEVINTRSAVEATDLLTIEGEPTANVEKGTVEFKLRRQNTPDNSDQNKDKVNTVALQATMKGEALSSSETNANVVVTSPYVRVYDDIINQADLYISDKETLGTNGDAAHFATTVTAAQAEDPRYEVIYDKEFNLKELIATCVNKEDDDQHNAMAIDDYKLSYRFSVATTEYNLPTGETTTNQQTVIQCTDAEEGLYAITEGFGRETIGRTPILRVELVDESGRVLRRGFVKVKVVAEKSADYMVGETFDLVLRCNEDMGDKDGKPFELDEEWMRKNVYRQITSSRGDVSLSHEEFWNMYEVADINVEKDGVQASSDNKPQVIEGSASEGVATKKIVWNFIHGNAGTIGTDGAVFNGYVILKNKLEASEYPAQVTLYMSINVTLPQLDPKFTINEAFWTTDKTAFQSNVQRPDSETDEAGNCQFETPLKNAFSSITLGENLPECKAQYYRLAGIYNGETKLADGVEIYGDTADDQVISLDKSNEAIKEALNNDKGLLAVVEYVVEFDNGDVVVANTFNVRFVTPVTLSMPEGKTVVDAKTGGDMVDFGGYQMLTDWRGYAITSPETTEELVQWGFWKHNPGAHGTTVIPGWNKIVRPAEWKIEFESVEISTGITVYTGSVDVTYTYRHWDWDCILPEWKKRTKSVTYTTEAWSSVAAVKQDLARQILAGKYKYMKEGEMCTDIDAENYAFTENVGKTTVNIIKSIDYIPEEVLPVDPVVKVNKKHTATKPNYEGQDGDMVGCWQWISMEEIKIATTPGAYWDFYGVFGDLKLDVTKARTSLTYNGGKLPADVVLTQVGNTVKYENVGSPISQSYTITIPASIDYGWGTAETELTITVNPAGK